MLWLGERLLLQVTSVGGVGRPGAGEVGRDQTHREPPQVLGLHTEAVGSQWEPLKGFERGQPGVLDHSFWWQRREAGEAGRGCSSSREKKRKIEPGLYQRDGRR